MQLSWALKLWANPKNPLKRLFTALYPRVKQLLFYIVKHPLKSLIRFLKFYLLLMLTLMFLGFALSGVVHAQEHNPCPDGGTLFMDMCTTSIGQTKTWKVTQVRAYGSRYNSIAEFRAAHTTLNACDGVTWPESGYSNQCTITDFSLTEDFQPTKANSYPFEIFSETRTYITSLTDGVRVDQPVSITHHTGSTGTNIIVDATEEMAHQCPPPGQSQFNLGPFVTSEGQNLCYYPAVPAEPEPECDCRNYAGTSLSSFNDLKVPVGTYTQENPPQCVEQREYAAGRDEPLRCRCQVSAKKWFSSYGGFKDGVEYETWSTLPTEIGQPSGTFTGVKCGETDAGPIEPEEDAPKECFTLANGIKWCWADQDKKCARIDGVMTCETGCGTINGDFVCMESPDDPTLPDPPPVDDDINDPDKPSSDMKKSDFKEINRGIESRLDVLAQLIQQANARPGVSMQDTNRALGELGNKLDILTGVVQDGFDGLQQDGDNEGGGDDEVGGPINYDTDRLTEFTNPNDWEQRNFGTVLMDATDRIKQTPVFSSAATFFDVSFNAECPVWSTTFTVFNQSFDFTVDQQCSSVMNQIWPWVRAILLLCFAYLSFRVAYE